MFRIGDRVSVTLASGLHKGTYLGVVEVIERLPDGGALSIDERKSGRFGVVLDENPFAASIPYFWEDEITLVESA